MASLARTSLGGAGVQKVLRGDLRIDALRDLPAALHGDIPTSAQPIAGRPPRVGHGTLPLPQAPWSLTSETLREAYGRGEVTPRQITERILAAARGLAARTSTMGPFLEYADDDALRMADIAGERIRRGEALGPLDGIPYAVKEQTAVQGRRRRAGTTFMSDARSPKDATCIQRLHQAGAIVVGMTPMTELGMSPTGVSSKRVMPHNPHGENRIAGGSSTGSGVAVATGVVPFAMGGDGGGSIRIPAALNGVFGMKPTWGRISREGDAFGGTVGHLGPLATSTLDLARVLDTVSGGDPLDRETLGAPPGEDRMFERALGRGVRGLVIGVAESEWKDSHPDVARAGQAMIAALEKEGAIIRSIVVPGLQYAPAVGYITIGTEARSAFSEEYAAHAGEMGPDLAISFAALEAFSALEYMNAQRLRSGIRAAMARAFQDVDLFALPTTAETAAEITEDERASGILDARLIDALCRFCFLGNITGLPAISMPAGKDGHGMPIGFQLVGDAWDEGTVLAAAAHLERIGAAEVMRPHASVDVLMGH
jgi:aspartyl-tRNA(Asn)/glutamyl-tRNA(Gln) amidotransferase subunit A